MKKILLLAAALLPLAFASCSERADRIDVILDTDANNELDDQHAIAYLLLNPETFRTLAITTNVTINGGIDAQCEEVGRVAAMLGDYGKDVKIIPGAEAKFDDIRGCISEPRFDGQEAVDFIIESARAYSPEKKLTVIAIGKLTNIALALLKAPDIADKIRLVWLGTNYPDGGEHNLVCDIPSSNFVIDTGVQMEWLVCRYGKSDGTWNVRVPLERVQSDFAGKGPQVKEAVEGRHGGYFQCFGDYSVDLFSHIRLGKDHARSLYDLIAVEVVKDPTLGQTYEIPAPLMSEGPDGEWISREDNPRKVTVWHNFNSERCYDEFLDILEKTTP